LAAGLRPQRRLRQSLLRPLRHPQELAMWQIWQPQLVIMVAVVVHQRRRLLCHLPSLPHSVPA
jgi:hypothetical protein